MTTDGMLNILLTVILPFLMALGGGVLATEALQSELKKRWWIAFFVLLFFVSVILAFVQQIRFTRQEQVAEQKAQQAELRSSGDIKYMQGQLDTMNRLLGTLATNSDPKQTALLLQSLTASSSTLKKDTFAICNEMEQWTKQRLKTDPFPEAAIPTKATQKENEAQNAYWQKFNNDYYIRFGPRVLGIVQRYAAKGADVKMIELQAGNGYMPNNIAVQLRALADRLDDNGNLKD